MMVKIVRNDKNYEKIFYLTKCMTKNKFMIKKRTKIVAPSWIYIDSIFWVIKSVVSSDCIVADESIDENKNDHDRSTNKPHEVEINAKNNVHFT